MALLLSGFMSFITPWHGQNPKVAFFLLLYKSYSTVAQAPSGVCEHDDVA